MGFKYDIQKTLEKNTIGYFNTKRRIVSNKPRAIHESKELHVPSEHSKAYPVVKELISQSGDIHQYLSRKIKDINDNDLLLNEWGIQHLHFLPERTKDILFVRFTDKDAFIIQVLPHGHGHSDVWVNTMLIEILHNNWPESIAQYKAAGISGEHLNAIERINLRKNHANVAVTVSDSTLCGSWRRYYGLWSMLLRYNKLRQTVCGLVFMGRIGKIKRNKFRNSV